MQVASLAQLEERILGKDKAPGSTPGRGFLKYGFVIIGLPEYLISEYYVTKYKY